MRSVRFTVIVLLMIMPGCASQTSPTPTLPATQIPTATASPTPVPTVTLATPTPAVSPTATPRLINEATPGATPVQYVVQTDDTLSGIAEAYAVTVAALVEENALESPDVIYPGQVLRIPAAGTVRADPPASTPVPTATLDLTLTPAPTHPPLTPALITHGDRSRPYVALTFDACQTPTNPAGYDAALINVLTETQTPATLFLGGLWMQSHPTQTQTLATNPLFELGNHSWGHPDFVDLTPEEITREITMTQDTLFTLTGQTGTLFRLPFGTYNDDVLEVIARQGLHTIQWDVESGDPNPNLLAEDLIDRVTSQAQNGSIVIMHMNERGWHTAEALPTIIETLRAQGYTLVTVSQVLGLAPVATP